MDPLANATVQNPPETHPTYIPGLEGVIAAQTRLSHVDGQAGELIIAGFPVEEIAPRAAFEEVVYLLWYGALPDASQLASFSSQLAAGRPVSPEIIDLLQAAPRRGLPVMNALRMAVAALDLQPDEDGADRPVRSQAARLLAPLPGLVAAYRRILHGQTPLDPLPDLGYAANYLYQLSGILPSPSVARALETYLNVVVDHGLNASTFTARVIDSTGSDLVSSLTGAIGALKGPLHGGAPGPALDMVFEIGESSRIEPYLRAKLSRGERLMGFGHRVYRVRDPRAEILSRAAADLFRASGDLALYDLAREVEAAAVRLLGEYHPGRKLQTNVEFYTALLLHGLGLETALFTPTFTISRAAGWLAHCLEQRRNSRLIRPASEYIGDRNRRWLPIDRR